MKVTVQHMNGLRSLVTVGAHTVVVDPAPEDGGTGTALSAPQLFAAAVGACILEFVANSCRLHGNSFEHLSLQMEVEEQQGPRRLGNMRATILVEPDPPEDVKQRLPGVARHATLVNTLVRPPEVTIQLVGKAE